MKRNLSLYFLLASSEINDSKECTDIIMCTYVLREAIVQKIPEFYEIFSQTGGGGQPDFISLIQKC